MPRRTHTRALVLVAHFTRDCTCGSRYDESLRVFSKIIPSSVMSLLGVPSTPFPRVFFTLHLTDNTSDFSNANTRNQIKPCATPLGDGLSGRLAGPDPKHILYPCSWCWATCRAPSLIDHERLASQRHHS